MNVNRGPVGPSTRWSEGAEKSWGPYWDRMFPPRQVTSWSDFKRGSSGVNIARRYWDQREYLRQVYESVYGPDPAGWPSRHPGVLLDAVRGGAHGACLGCQWFDAEGAGPGALLLARRHETSDGELR